MGRSRLRPPATTKQATSHARTIPSATYAHLHYLRCTRLRLVLGCWYSAAGRLRSSSPQVKQLFTFVEFLLSIPRSDQHLPEGTNKIKLAGQPSTTSVLILTKKTLYVQY
jgi:hypothetical protein